VGKPIEGFQTRAWTHTGGGKNALFFTNYAFPKEGKLIISARVPKIHVNLKKF
jgi:hypothetical protein